MDPFLLRAFIIYIYTIYTLNIPVLEKIDRLMYLHFNARELFLFSGYTFIVSGLQWKLSRAIKIVFYRIPHGLFISPLKWSINRILSTHIGNSPCTLHFPRSRLFTFRSFRAQPPDKWFTSRAREYFIPTSAEEDDLSATYRPVYTHRAVVALITLASAGRRRAIVTRQEADDKGPRARASGV